MMAALEAGAEEIEPHAEGFEVITEATDLVAVRSALQEAGIDYESADVEFVPNLKVEIDADNRSEGLPPDRCSRRQRRRAERVHQLRPVGRGAGRARERRRVGAPDGRCLLARLAWGSDLLSARARHRPRAHALWCRIVDVDPSRRGTLVHVGVIRSSPDAETGDRLAIVAAGIRAVIAEHRPDAVAVERVFAQQNTHSVMGTAQASGVALLIRGPSPGCRRRHAHAERGQGRRDRLRCGRQAAGADHDRAHSAPGCAFRSRLTPRTPWRSRCATPGVAADPLHPGRGR